MKQWSVGAPFQHCKSHANDSSEIVAEFKRAAFKNAFCGDEAQKLWKCTLIPAGEFLIFLRELRLTRRISRTCTRRWWCREWPGCASGTREDPSACWRSSGHPSWRPGSTAPSPATPTSTSTCCTPPAPSSGCTAGTSSWGSSPRPLTGKLASRFPSLCCVTAEHGGKAVSVPGFKCQTKTNQCRCH